MKIQYKAFFEPNTVPLLCLKLVAGEEVGFPTEFTVWWKAPSVPRAET